MAIGSRSNLSMEVISTTIAGRNIKLYWRPYIEAIPTLLEEGVVPIELAEGTISYVDDMKLDHHNQLSHMPAACMTAMKYYGKFTQKNNKVPYCFMVNHVDLDCVLSAAVLLGLIEYSECRKLVYYAALADTDPLNSKLYRVPTYYIIKMMRTWQSTMKDAKYSGWGWIAGLQQLYSMFSDKDSWNEKLESFNEKEESRRKIAIEDYNHRIESTDKSLIFIGPARVWGYDILFNRNNEVNDSNELSAWKHQVAMTYNGATGKITIACPNEKVAEKLFGRGGLNNVYSTMENFNYGNWGGRTSIGGSSRHHRLSLKEAQDCFFLLEDLMQTKFHNKEEAAVT